MSNVIAYKRREAPVPLPDGWQENLPVSKRLWDGEDTGYPHSSWGDDNILLCWNVADMGHNDPDIIDALLHKSGRYRAQWDLPCRRYRWDPSHSAEQQTCGEVTIGYALQMLKDDVEAHEAARAVDVIEEAYHSLSAGRELENVEEIQWALNFVAEEFASLGKYRPMFSFVNRYIDGMRKEPAEIDDISLSGWSDPPPFNDYSNLPTFPSQSITGVCGDMAQDVAESCQVDQGLPCSMVLAVISTAVSGKVQVDLGTHREPCNIYTIAVIGSGNRKSEVVGQLAGPIYAFQRDRQEAMAPDIREAESKRRILEKRLDRLQKDAASKDDPSERKPIIQQCNDVLAEIDANPVPKKPVFLVDDITPEALGQLMADNGEKMAILSAEGGIFKLISGLYSNGQSNIDLFLKAHASDYWSNNRIGRESKMMTHPALTLGLAVQPNVIEEIGKNSEFRERGLSARFLYALCQSKAGYRTRQSAPVPPHVSFDYHKKITSLMAIDSSCVLTLSPEAQSLWDEFYDEIEKSLRPGGNLEYLVDWGSKLPGAVARISGLLHFADLADGLQAHSIKKEIVRAACDIGFYYLDHAKAIFGLMKEDPTINVAKKILDYIKIHRPDILIGRDLFNHTNLQSMQDIQPGLNALVERGYIKELYMPTTHKSVGRPAATRYEINPKIFLNT